MYSLTELDHEIKRNMKKRNFGNIKHEMNADGARIGHFRLFQAMDRGKERFACWA